MKRYVFCTVMNKDKVSLYELPQLSSLPAYNIHAHLHIQLNFCIVLRSRKENVLMPANRYVAGDAFDLRPLESERTIILSEPVTVLCQDPLWTGRKWQCNVKSLRCVLGCPEENAQFIDPLCHSHRGGPFQISQQGTQFLHIVSFFSGHASCYFCSSGTSSHWAAWV